ncbi:CvpA family protein [Candidatus Liberibacter sp.]|uniref:CvpA family protein n=1 Tax=Candidatus Liberibacter sp. TaxID=34022 RepID=UPI0015F58C63|nr:CvpA family protein [Candidatus Liberibacter sp.]MBA5724023.1 CvpA family protein [Candidatus Liberibacter sp.]
MGITYFDILCLGVILFSAMLAMVRGMFHEIISIANWTIAFATTNYLYPLLLGIISHYILSKQIAMLVTVVPLFLVILILVSALMAIITGPINKIHSKPFDRSLGFLFGGIRGLLVLIVATSFWNLMVSKNKEPDWINFSKSKYFLDIMVNKLSLTTESTQLAKNLDIIKDHKSF